MGHQITFHMLQEDAEEFFRFLGSKLDLFVTAWTSDSDAVIRCERPALERTALALWNQHLKAQQARKKIERDDGSVVYEFDWQDSVLEFSPSAIVTHEKLPSLLQGRLYDALSEMSPETSGLFRTAKQWIKRSFRSCPFKLLGGYIGPAAMRWYQEGGILLPIFNPPATQVWEDFFNSQHRTQSNP